MVATTKSSRALAPAVKKTPRSSKRPNPYLASVRQFLEEPPASRKNTRSSSGWSSPSYDTRSTLVGHYAWAIPSTRAITRIVGLGPVVEIGAGTGYWAKLISDAGGDIIAYDSHPPDSKKNDYCDELVWHPVLEGGPEITAEHPDRTLLLCWPPYDNRMASRALRHFAGDTLVYVGESRGGCTADAGFFRQLESSWKQVGHCTIPQWPNKHDELVIYQRR